MKRIGFLLIIGFMVSALGLQAADGGQQNDCSICLETMNGLQAPEITRLSCGAEAGGHVFHTNCIADARRVRGQFLCPLDRGRLSDQDINAIKDNYQAHRNIPNPQDIIARRESIFALGGLAIMAAFFYGLYHLYHDDPYAEQKSANSEFDEIRRRSWIAYGWLTRMVGFLPASVIWPLAYLKHADAEMSAERDYMIGKLPRKDAIATQEIMAKKHWNFLRKSSQMVGHIIISGVALAAFHVMVEKLIKLPNGQPNLPAIFR